MARTPKGDYTVCEAMEKQWVEEDLVEKWWTGLHKYWLTSKIKRHICSLKSQTYSQRQADKFGSFTCRLYESIIVMVQPFKKISKKMVLQKLVWTKSKTTTSFTFHLSSFNKFRYCCLLASHNSACFRVIWLREDTGCGLGIYYV